MDTNFIQSQKIPFYVGDSKISIKKYRNVYEEFLISSHPYGTILKELSIDIKKLKKESDFSLNIEQPKIDIGYIFCYIIFCVKSIIEISFKAQLEIIKSFDRSDINNAIKIFDPNSRKYSILNLIDLVCNYNPKKTSLDCILRSISECPKGHYFSGDLFIYMKSSFFSELVINTWNSHLISGILPFCSTDSILFQYLHVELFGMKYSQTLDYLNSFSDVEKKMECFLCIDNGKTVPLSKKSLYKNVNTEVMIVSNNDSLEIFKKSVKYILDYLPERFSAGPSLPKQVEVFEKNEASVRKTIPKSLKSKLWKQYFENSMIGKCYCCSSEIDGLGNWEAGHIQAAALGGADTIENLRPVCSTCNKSMGTMHMDEFKKKFFLK